jgi:hypothetical protein
VTADADGPAPPGGRAVAHGAVGSALERLGDAELRRLIGAAPPGATGIGGGSRRVTVAGRPVFVKLVPLTALELAPSHVRSTANLFRLPAWFQYGIGSVGFGAWRELAAHGMATDWVLSGACAGFPLLHHWRVVDGLPATAAAQEPYFAPADAGLPGAAAVQARFAAVRAPAAHLALFLECFEHNLRDWLLDELVGGDERAERAVAEVEAALQHPLAFLATRRFVHFDAHFENMLTDGEQIVLSDFGLASCEAFDLDEDERTFLARHADYDRCRAATSLVLCIAGAFGGGRPWHTHASDPSFFADHPLPPGLQASVRRHSPVALLMREFALKLRHESKLTPYPAARLASLLQALSR